MPRVPFLNLPEQHQALRQEIHDAVLPLFDRAGFVGGDPVTAFERAFAAAQESPHAVSVKSGTSALHLALEAMGVGPGDEVIVPAFTFIATAAPVVRCGATPVFADVTPDTACLDPEAAARAVTAKTKALLPVHLYGHPAPMDELMELARSRGLQVLEDCAQAHLARWRGRSIATFGDAGAFSFYPSKNLGAAGDAGAVVSGNEALCERIRQLANHGRSGRYDHAFLGWNERLDAIQAAVLDVKLRHLPRWTAERREAACRYHELLDGVAPWGEPLVAPPTRDGAEHVYHLYVIRHSRRDELAAILKEAGIDTGVHYPTTVPAQPAFRDLGLGDGSFPVAEAWAETCLALPLFPGITREQQEHVAATLRAVGQPAQTS